MRAVHSTATVLLVLAATSVASCGAPSTVSITVDGSAKYQIIDGWVTSSRYWEEDKEGDRFDRSFEPYVDAIARFLVNEVGINAVRLELLSGSENPIPYWRRFYAGEIGYREYAKQRFEKVNDDADPLTTNPAGFQFDLFDYRVETSVLPLKRALEARGERLWINVCYVDFKGNARAGSTRQGDLSHAQHPAEYAEFIRVYLRRLQDKFGLTPDSLELVLEPENTLDWRGREIGEALLAVTDRVRQDGFEPKILAPSNMSMSHAIEYFDEMLRVPGVAARLDTFVYHRYRQQRTSDVERIRSRAAAHGVKTAMLEKLNGTIDMLMEDLTVGHVSAWQLWGPAGRQRGEPNGDVYALVDATTDPSAPAITRAHRADELAHVFRYVRRGAQRIGARSSWSGLATAAFINPDRTWVVVVRTHDRNASVRLAGLPAGKYEYRFTPEGTPHGEARPLSVEPGSQIEVPVSGRGVLTVYGVAPAAPSTR
jgi:O-glycosyl hydrolase